MTDSPHQPPPSEGRERADVLLVRAALNGDRYAFDELVERYQGKIYNLALGVTGNAQDARDAVQSAFLKAYENLARFDSAYKFFSWIYRIAANEAIDIIKRQRRVLPLDADTPATSAGPHRRAAASEAGEAIRAALAELSPEQRVTIVLRHFHGLTYREMSEVIGVPEDRVRSRLFSARVKLRQRLSEKGLAPDGAG